MKKTLLGILSFMVGIGLFAQEEENERDFDFGVKAGINFSNLSGESTKDHEGRETSVDPIIGFHVGGFINYEFSERFAIQPELLLSYQGANIEITRWENVPVEAEGNVSMPYILLPIMLQFEPMDDLVIELGPQLGYNLSRYIDIKGKVELEGETFYLEDRIKDVAKFDFSIAAGVGYEVIDDFMLKLRFTQGLNTLDQREENAFELYNQIIMLGVEYEF